MYLSYTDLKKILYVMGAVCGLVMIVFSVYLLGIARAAADPLGYYIPALILFVVGIGCVFFGVETYILRNEPDIWR